MEQFQTGPDRSYLAETTKYNSNLGIPPTAYVLLEKVQSRSATVKCSFFAPKKQLKRDSFQVWKCSKVHAAVWQ